MDMDDGTLRKRIFVSVLTMGGGCALFLSLLGGASLLVARMGSGPAPRESTIVIPSENGSTPAAAPTTKGARGDGSRGSTKSEI